MVRMLQIEESRKKWKGGRVGKKKEDMVQREYHDSLLSPSPTPQHFFLSICSPFCTILHYLNTWNRLKIQRKNKQGVILC